MTDCLFCRIIAGDVPAHIVLADSEVVAFLDARPVFKGHLLAAPGWAMPPVLNTRSGTAL